jgi:hypothetical protein
LFLRGAEFVVGLENFVGENLVLDGDGDGDEDIVFGFGFDVDVSLSDLQVHEADGFAPGHKEVEAGLGDATEFAEALDDARRVGADGVHGFDNGDENEDADDGENDGDEHRSGFHGRAFLRLHVSGAGFGTGYRGWVTGRENFGRL